MENTYLAVRKPLRAKTSVPVIEATERATQIQASAIFAGLSFVECLHIASYARLQTFARHQTFFMQGEPFRTFSLIDSGCVKLTYVSESGSEVILALRGRGDTLDLPGGLIFDNHTYTAQAMVSSRILVWTTATMSQFMAHAPLLNHNICRILTRQLAELQLRYYELSSEKVERRLACVLIRLAAQIGIRSRVGIEISTSRQELAQMAGTTLFTVSRVVSRWSECGLVVPRREGLVMLDLNRLDLATSTPQSHVLVDSDHQPVRVPSLQ